VRGAAPFVQAQGMLSFGQSVRGAMVRGILPDEEDKVADFRAHIKEGQARFLQPDAFNIVLGSELARALGVFPGDKVTVIAPQGVVTPAGVVPRLKTFTVSGIFEVGMFEYDSGLALIRMEDAQKLYRMEDRVLRRAPQARRPVPRAVDGAGAGQYA
jgi:lipoprotein-releasing system permease protein